MKICQSLQQCTSLEQVVDLINTSTEYEAEDLAAQYAYDAIEASGNEVSESEIESHLDILREKNAKFNYSEALEIAMTA